MQIDIPQTLIRWRSFINQPDWYSTIYPDFLEIGKASKELPATEQDQIKKQIYDFFETHLEQGDIALGKTGPNWDVERQKIDSVIIHHTSNPPGLTWQRLSAMHLIRLYAAYYNNPGEAKKEIKGQPIYSHHFRDSQPVFYGYHWLIREDGNAECLLADSEIGWQAGKWESNCKSVGICIDADLENATPSAVVLASVAHIIKKYPDVTMLGHCEVNPQTECPGKQFLTGWKANLMALL